MEIHVWTPLNLAVSHHSVCSSFSNQGVNHIKVVEKWLFISFNVLKTFLGMTQYQMDGIVAFHILVIHRSIFAMASYKTVITPMH